MFYTQSKKITAIALALSVCLGLSMPAQAANTYNDIDEITSHVNFKVPSKLTIYSPSEDIKTNASAYFIAGGSDPDKKLTVNGKEISSRGARGSFGVYVNIGAGVNTFTFRQGDASVSVNITKGSPSATTINTVRSMAPEFDCATYAGETINLSCEAPSGASVVATIGGRNIQMEQAASASPGVPALFSGRTTAGDVKGTKNLGRVTYTMTYEGKTTSYQSAGSVFISDGTLVVQVKNAAASVYDTEQRAYFEGVAKLGAVDYVTDIGKNSYQLSSGGWIPKDSVNPLTGNVAVKNRVSDTSFELVSGGENIILSGTSHPMYRVTQDADRLTFKLYNTTGVEKPNISDSKLFSRVRLAEEEDVTTIQFELDGKKSLWGYDITYKNGVTTIYTKYKPVVTSKSDPLSGITVVVDAGHGGTDCGALGIPGTSGPSEADINLAAAIAVQKRLEKLGARVIMTRTEDIDLTMNDRMMMTRQNDADFFVSMHSNTVGFTSDATKPSGVEAYYYYGTSKKLAANAASKVAGYTNRVARGEKFSNYRVTLNSFCPSVLVEMGFLSNPVEYDNMTSRSAIFKTANAIGDSIIASLK